MAVAVVGQPVAGINNLTGATISFASFSPNAGSSYIVGFAANSTGTSPGSNMTPSWASGGSGTWTQLATYQANIFQPRCSIWYCHCTAAPGASVVTLTTNGQCTRVMAYIVEITGDNTATPAGASITSATAANTISITPNQTGSWIFHAASDLNEGFTPVANAASSLFTGFLSSGGAVAYGVRSSAATTAATPVAVGVTNAVTANIQLAAEITPAAVAAPKAALRYRTQPHAHHKGRRARYGA